MAADEVAGGARKATKSKLFEFLVHGVRPGMPSGARMPHQGAPMGPPGSPYMGSPAVRPGLAPAGMEPARKRAAPPPGQSQAQSQGQPVPTAPARSRSAKRRKMADKILPQRIRELVPESQAYMDLLAFERKLDQTIMRKRVDIQEALKRPMKQKRKLRLYISNTFNPAKPDAEDSDGSIASWELRVEGKLLDDPSKQKRKFSSFFKSLVIELDKDLYGPDNHLVEWHRTPTTQETDGFQVKRPGDLSVRCTLLLMLDYQPPQFKLDPRLARLLGLHTQSRSAIVQALWQYVKTNRLQDSHDKEYINGDKYFQQIFDCPRLKFSEIPQRLTGLLLPPDPIVINHVISVDPSDQKKTACYDIDVEVEEPLKGQMSSFLLSTANQQEISALDNPRDDRVHKPAQDPEGLHAKLLQRPQGLRPRPAPLPEPGPQGDDGCGRQPRGRAPGRVLPPALVSGSGQPLLLLQDPAAQAGVGAVAGRAQHLGAWNAPARPAVLPAPGPVPLRPGGGAGRTGLKVTHLTVVLWSLHADEGGHRRWGPRGQTPPHPPQSSPYPLSPYT
ncbi:SWI/SNF-related matrix-associated actin-dependent regulator of chromatin subfamily D member 3 isoform X2 [Perognathus longimembris pacificus]|uniref:SWI/SNF-related matrix-associated actin-dependent regulator of chromatin subfamily D member 3 isoform X2 n=1 Tax=Perognathus longimembris pacificus TaxID=214514 RepID=UPI00201A0A3A|nr:SWI/SNF-related matrix-associated actin-dependent regulator of chromatin subfamily D member 3 isoform X2 [Perognathus longimembris pacificus]